MIQLKNVLLIDDDEINNFITRNFIYASDKISFHQITEFSNGEDALIYLAGNRDFLNALDLIILDINMPRMDGFEFLKALPRLSPMTDTANIPIMMLSSSIRHEDKVKSLSFYNVKAYVSKPLTKQILTDFIREYILIIRQHL